MADIKPNQIEKLLVELIALKEKMANAKEILKSYKIKSDKLTQLQKVKKELLEQITDEKDKIEDEFYADKDYETSKNDELTYKNQIREKNSELRELMAKVNVDQQLSTYDYNIKGEPLKMQVERVVKVYINGKEER
jgi:hypothetical protein